MKITRSKLKQLIKEELDTILREDRAFDASQELRNLVGEAIRRSAMAKMNPDILKDQNVQRAIEGLHDAVLDAQWDN